MRTSSRAKRRLRGCALMVLLKFFLKCLASMCACWWDLGFNHNLTVKLLNFLLSLSNALSRAYSSRSPLFILQRLESATWESSSSTAPNTAPDTALCLSDTRGWGRRACDKRDWHPLAMFAEVAGVVGMAGTSTMPTELNSSTSVCLIARLNLHVVLQVSACAFPS